MRRLFTTCFVMSCMAAGQGALAQTDTLDQSSPRTNAAYNVGTNVLLWQAQIRAGISGQLEGIMLTIQGPEACTFEVRVRIGDGPNNNPTVFVGTVTKTKPENQQEQVFVDMTGANIQLSANGTFVMETQGNSGANLIGSYVDPNEGPPLYPEPLFLNGGEFLPGWKHGFDTYMLTDGPCYADCDQSGELDIDDFICFQTEFGTGGEYADCDLSGELDIDDFICFQTAFGVGCP